MSLEGTQWRMECESETEDHQVGLDDTVWPKVFEKYAQEYIDSNHLYMRLASTEIFAVSQDAGHKMMTGEHDAKSAYEAFNAQITNDKLRVYMQIIFIAGDKGKQ